MTNPELSDEPVRVFRESEAVGHATSGSVHESTRHNYNTATRDKHVSKIIELDRADTGFVEVVMPLLIEVDAISRTNSPPASRIHLHTCQRINRTVLK
jgi:hypothetical protein